MDEVSLLAKRRQKGEFGQAMLEYILLLAVLVSLFSLVLNGLTSTDALSKIKRPLEKDFAYTYRYGNKDARGQEDGGPKYVPLYNEGENFRIFINPPIKE